MSKEIRSFCSALSHPTRIAIVRYLIGISGEVSQGDLAEAIKEDRHAMRHHIARLVGSGIVWEREGEDRRVRLYRVSHPDRIRDILETIETSSRLWGGI